jgi:hypothetical protein
MSHLVLNYRPSQPHAWGDPDPSSAMTIGGHTTAQDFTLGSKSYRIDLLQSGDSRDPVYEDFPADATLNFRKTLDTAFGVYYSFRYAGGFRGRNEFNVQSHSVVVRPATETTPLLYGADLYVVYNPDTRAGDPVAHSTLRWIQVVKLGGSAVPPGLESPFVDNGRSANPFYAFGGYTAINGNRVFTVDYASVRPAMAMPGDVAVLSDQFTAEVFLAQDTGTKDSAGKDVVNIFGGIKYGWQVRETQP